jgi:hypothetical protein
MDAGDGLKAHAGGKNVVFRSTGNRGASANRITGAEISIIHLLAGILPWTRHGRGSAVAHPVLAPHRTPADNERRARGELGSWQMLGDGLGTRWRVWVRRRGLQRTTSTEAHRQHLHQQSRPRAEYSETITFMLGRPYRCSVAIASSAILPVRRRRQCERRATMDERK